MEKLSSRWLRPRRASKPACSQSKPCPACLPIVAKRLMQKDGVARLVFDAGGQDPVEALGEDILLKILLCLDSQTLATCLRVSKSWGSLVKDDLLWLRHYEELCKGKAAVPQAALSAPSKLAAFGICVQDSQRTKIMVEDLCGTAFEFRFKWSAGEFWRNLDPSWRSEPPFIRVFHPNNVVSPGPNDTVFNDMTWRFTKSRDGKLGRYVRINQWPSLSVSRSENWGWILQNCWVTYTSIPNSELGKKLPAELQQLIVSRR